MFVLLRDVSAAKKAIATLLAAALLLWAIGPVNFIARADNVQDASDLMTDTAWGADSDHTITFTLVNDLLNTETVVVDFPDAFDFTGVTAGDVGIWGGGGTFSAGTVTAGVDTISFSNTGATIASGTLITITATGTNKIANPTTDPNTSNSLNGNESYEITLSAGSDTGYTRVVILDTVLVTANVDTIFNFTVNGLPTGATVNGTSTDITTSSTTIPFGTLTAYTKVTGAQNLTVETNAINGFVVTVQSDGYLESSTGADIDNFEDGGDTNTPTIWSSPSVGLNIAQENTWGHWGVTTEDNDTDGMRDGDEFGSEEFIGVSTTPRQIFAHDGPADASTTNIGSTTVGYQVEISPLQEAADDYSTVLTYIATPTF